MDEIAKKLNELYKVLEQMPLSSDLKEQLYEKQDVATIFGYMERMLELGNQCDEILKEVDKETKKQPISKEDSDKLNFIKWASELNALIKQDLKDDFERGAIKSELLLRIDECSNYAKSFYKHQTLTNLNQLDKKEKQLKSLEDLFKNMPRRSSWDYRDDYRDSSK